MIPFLQTACHRTNKLTKLTTSPQVPENVVEPHGRPSRFPPFSISDFRLGVLIFFPAHVFSKSTIEKSVMVLGKSLVEPSGVLSGSPRFPISDLRSQCFRSDWPTRFRESPVDNRQWFSENCIGETLLLLIHRANQPCQHPRHSLQLFSQFAPSVLVQYSIPHLLSPRPKTESREGKAGIAVTRRSRPRAGIDPEGRESATDRVEGR
jgi:hypothetical protein